MTAEKNHAVGIVGAGMAGLYATHLLQTWQGHSKIDVHLYELTGQPGGRVKTHHFTSEKDQYYEAGAMRIPQTQMHKRVMLLIDYLNEFHNAGLEVIDYKLYDRGNIVFVNGISGSVSSQSQNTAGGLGFEDVPEPYSNQRADQLLYEAIIKFVLLLKENFDEGWELILKYDKSSFRSYLEEKEGWHPAVVGFVETMCSQTNQFALSFPEMIMQCLDFEEKEWKTLGGGMDTLPQSLARVVGLEKITFGARVQEIEGINGKVRIHADTAGGPISRLYDKVILAIPPSTLRMIPKRPRWSPRKEEAIRSMYFEALYKMGLRFKTRFWEHVDTPSY